MPRQIPGLFTPSTCVNPPKPQTTKASSLQQSSTSICGCQICLFFGGTNFWLVWIGSILCCQGRPRLLIRASACYTFDKPVPSSYCRKKTRDNIDSPFSGDPWQDYIGAVIRRRPKCLKFGQGFRSLVFFTRNFGIAYDMSSYFWLAQKRHWCPFSWFLRRRFFESKI